jgi:hypothetical protein
MSTEPIAWHRECLKNMTAHLERYRKEAARLVAEMESLERRVTFYADQITTAEARGMAAFDQERLLVKRKK